MRLKVFSTSPRAITAKGPMVSLLLELPSDWNREVKFIFP